MSQVLITTTLLDNLADSLSDKIGVNTPISLEDMTDAVEAITTRSSTDLSASGATVTAPAGYYGASATKTVASGSEGTPTATKGTVSNHSITVTPSVTNTAGYIAGGTKTGTGVSVAASELVSGSETKTSNGTYNVTNLAQLIVSVSGGGGGSVTQDQDGYIVLPPTGGSTPSVSGLEYESGTWTPAEDIANTTISFTNTHTEPPFFYMIIDSTGSYSDELNSNHGIIFSMYDAVFGSGDYGGDGTNIRYGGYFYWYRATTATSFSSSSGQITYPSSNTSTLNYNYYRYWATTTGIRAYLGSSSRYWRSNRTYKWIAIWAPTT